MSRPRLVIALIVVAAAARSLSLTFLHPLNWDEIEFFRATDWVRQGLVPYRDFFEHHTPLQWFLFAPIVYFVRSPGAAAVITMRWAQVPIWILTFWLLAVWMRRAGLQSAGRLSAILLALCSSLFMLPAIEYRIDTLGCALYVLALVLLQEADRSFPIAFTAGAVLCLAGFANIRLGPLLALTALLFRIVRPRERAWGGTNSANGIFAGVIAALVLCATYFAVTGSASIAFRSVWTWNYLGDRLSEGTKGLFLHRVAMIFGFRPLDPAQPLFDLKSVDIATAIILIVGLIGLGRVLIANRRAPDSVFVLGFLQVGNIFFVAAMKFIYTYHFEIVVVLMLPFVAAEIDRFATTRKRWAIVAAVLLLASTANVIVSVFRGKEADLAYQDRIMRDADRMTSPDGKVFDGVGWALRRRPAYRYWLLPKLVQVLEAKGIFEPYPSQRMIADPPAAIITDHNMYTWLVLHPQLATIATTHYLPAWRNLWLPGMSARFTPASPSAEWVVPASGAYRVYGSAVLSIHPWFRKALIFGTFESRNTEIALTGFAPASQLPLQWIVDGVPVHAADVLELRRGQRLRVTSSAGGPFGVMIVPSGVVTLFQQPPHGVTLDAAAPPVTHVPKLW
ncbi:MAG TPA: hypothetical protein VII12_16010 [Thermoanaerobaculia bacterium]